ncbi:hypothetical protein F2Q68_00006037 [Brassica cretica]|uniref:Uncharacterized protein n=1 Tax=Brassica cretica TaxID=69181 RepID=A0A8S9JCZ0_BRACR|nr:hypothetical protein F2Q68_00006037 [Brassica cretica]
MTEAEVTIPKDRPLVAMCRERAFNLLISGLDGVEYMRRSGVGRPRVCIADKGGPQIPIREDHLERTKRGLMVSAARSMLKSTAIQHGLVLPAEFDQRHHLLRREPRPCNAARSCPR